MKRITGIIFLILLVGMLAVGCSAPAKGEDKAAAETKVEYKDGTYVVDGEKFENGYKTKVTVVIKDGAVESVNWDGVGEKDSSKLKSDASKNGEYDMKKAGAKADWHEQAAAVEKFVVENGGVDKIKLSDNEGHTDAISGVSIHVGEFVELAGKALAEAKK